MDTRILNQAASLGGYITRAEILDCGYDDNAIRDALLASVLVRLRHGIYAPCSMHDSLTPEQQHWVLAISVADRAGPNVAISHHSSCAGHKLWLFGFDMSTVGITRLDGGHGRIEAGVAHHVGKINDDEIEMIDGRLTTKPSRSIWEAATAGTIESGMVVASSALHSGCVSEASLLETAGQFAHWRGSRSARIALTLADARFESPGEARSMHMFWRNAIPRPEPQRIIRGDDGFQIARVDFLWELYRHVGEFDGRVKYGKLLRPGEDPTTAVVREKVREDAVRGQSLGVSRWMTRDIVPPQDRHTCMRVQREMEQSRRLFHGNRTYIA